MCCYSVNKSFYFTAVIMGSQTVFSGECRITLVKNLHFNVKEILEAT